MTFPDLLAQLRAVEAEFGPDARVIEIKTLPPDPYLTRQTVVGHGNPALLIRLGPDGGLRLEAVAKGDDLDVHRKSLRAMYGRRNRKWRETGQDEGRSTAELAGNPNEALETETGDASET